ncbi:NAD(P)H-binding protein [Amycolatopsis sp., V23-08]|uniref:NAD(P)H-binding protein n=1 Tax=Amycolatopsis heterodermiae TaxID=3110235 RepID=A0ABU5R8C9_9PSEU|nr:NAD(P)H-binding protein [Amycolatopsis sp., V23-08]MEA5362502.1 NAD(P)H-binding protein [Amycolatopsis sp., V23-08]
MTTLVIGARGSVGRHVLDRLRTAGEPVRASVRDPAAAGLPPGVPVVAADLAAPETLTAALTGVRQVFLYATPAGTAAFTKAACDAGVEHVVLLSSGSVLLPSAHGNATAEHHRDVERTLGESGLRWTPIRPLVLANNALGWAASARAEGVVRLLCPEARTAPVHELDIAAVAVAALLEPGTGGVSELLTGGELISQRRQVQLLAEAAGRPLRVEELSASQAQQHFERFQPPEIATSIVDFITAAARGESPNTGTARRVLGREPLSFARWAADHAASFA